MLAGAAGHRTTSVASAKDKSGFENRRKNDDAFCFVENVLRKVVGNVENLHDDRSAVFQTISFFLLSFVVRGKAAREDAISKEIIRFNMIQLVIVFLAYSIIEHPKAWRTLGSETVA